MSFARVLLCLFVSVTTAWASLAHSDAAPSKVTMTGPEPYVAFIDMHMAILPGTAAFLSKSIEQASATGAKVLIVRLSTPGGMLSTSQEMIQEIFKSPIPVVFYVGPGGASATSAGVFITLAGHVAAMAPGTSIGSAHPVQSDGKDIEGDMRAKAEQMAIAMVKSIAEQRGRNVAWAEQAVKNSSSVTEKEALKLSVVDIVADGVPDLLRQLKGREVKLEHSSTVLDDYSNLPLKVFEMRFKDKIINVLANPNIAALLWLGATTGLSLELYTPGAILPGVVGIICLILALAVTEIIPLSQGGILLFIVGSFLIGLEFYIPSGILGIGGVVAMALGALYLVDVSRAPDMAVAYHYIVPLAAVLGGFMLFVAMSAVRAMHRRATTGADGLVGQHGKALENFTSKGKVSVNGEVWNAVAAEGIIEKGSQVEVLSMKEGLLLEVRKIS
ncbi:MAG: nodulation protein NfeD [Deltaproteobacteria bacterium]|nr:nodulation protein NfeD [Deltaproteobacteria bacterium]